MFVPVPPGRDDERPTTQGGETGIDPQTERELRAFVRSNANYYLRAWKPVLTGQGGIARANFAAFFFPAFWLGYRKMYGIFVVIAAIYVVEYLVEFSIFVAILGFNDPPWATSILFGFIVAIICGVCGNRWYLSHARRAISRTRAKGLDEGAYLRELSRVGGTSILAPLLLLLSLCVSWSLAVLLVVLIFGVV